MNQMWLVTLILFLIYLTLLQLTLELINYIQKTSL